MGAIRDSGKDNITKRYLKKASTVFANNAVVTVESATGHVIPIIAASTNIKGITRETITAADVDYATARGITLDVPRPEDLFVMPFSATITQAMVGDNFTLADSLVVNNTDAVAAVHVQLVGIVQATFTSAANPSYGLVRFSPVALFQTSAT